MHPPLCTDADDLLRCSATVGNLGERGEPDILLRALSTDQRTSILSMNPNYMETARLGIEHGTFGVLGER